MKLIQRETKIERTARVIQLEGMFDIPPSDRSALQWEVDLPIDTRDWNIGLIVGPSGCGKTTIARELFKKNYVRGFEWSKTRSIIDDFPDVSIKDVTMLLSSVGFSSPPSWVRPFHVLSNGEQFRVTLARALAENTELCVFDEFTSVVDRTVGKIGSASVAKTVRRRKQKFIAVTCHDDVIDWLDPDWVYTPINNTFQWRLLRGRPQIELKICRVHHSMWSIFASHHYLTRSLAHSAYCFCAFIDDRPVAFDAWMPFFGRSKAGAKMRRESRTVCLPDYQGIGIGGALTRRIAAMWRGLGFRATLSAGHPAVIAGHRNSPDFRMTSIPKRHARGNASIDRTARAINRLTASFEYIGPALDAAEADRQLNYWVPR